jgi:hypothetical protein
MSRPWQRKSGGRPKKKARPRPLRHERQWFLFCDESGNAGSNWLDVEQPFHVAAGWLVAGRDRDEFEAVVSSALEESQAPELKGSTLLRRERGIVTVIGVIERLHGLGLPLFIVADRAFCVAGKAVDTFLDPFTNPAAAWLPTGALRRRQDVWETVSALPVNALNDFATAYRSPTPDAFRAAAGGLARALRDARAPDELVRGFEGAVLLADSICEAETFDAAGGHGLATALNAPVFLHLVKKAERLLESMPLAHPLAELAIIHDNVARVDRVLADALKTLSVPTNRSAEYVGLDGELVRLGVKHVARFEVSDSRAVPGIQAADLLATSVAKLAREARANGEWPGALGALGSLIMPALIGDDPALAGMLGHRDRIAEVLRPLFRDAQPVEAPRGTPG